ncbi:MAG: hypothetical protein QOF62_940 [Pyrinomonadaceae bacterium]|jgi:hypothetical protein|nr:hypothetical protein [Pyrinomonadaceae bacterium]
MKTRFKVLNSISFFSGQPTANVVPAQTATSQRAVRWRGLILLACCLAISGCNRACNKNNNGGGSPTPTPISDSGNQVPGRDLREDPPKVDSIFARPLPNPTAEGNVIVLVQFAKDQNLPPQLTIDVEDGPLTLHDDGKNGDEHAQDGTYSAITKLDIAAFQKADQDRLSRAKDGTIPIFVQRAKVSEERISAVLERTKRFDLIDLRPFGLSSAVDIDRSLMIRAPTVVQDPTRTRTTCTGAGSSSMGKWSFGYVMQEMANTPMTGISASDFTMNWLQTWLSPQNINGWTVAQRNQIQNQVITPWLTASGGTTLDLSKAPFRLLAIVNRVDLRQNLVYGGGSAGEARFVFGVMDANCQALQFVVIFEYGIKKKGCVDLRNWAKQWKDLDLNPLGSPAYNTALEAITEQFVKANSDPAKPNGSALNQLRTNEIALSSPWELREFQVSGFLKPVTVKQMPDVSLNHTPTLVNYVNTFTPAILAGTYVVPLDFPAGTHFLGGAAPTNFGDFWNNGASPTIANRQARHLFSLGTCEACHSGETQTSFTHVKPAGFGAAVTLSGFLTGISVVDPADGSPTRLFNDLQRRAVDLDALVNSSCLRIFPIERVHQVH